MSDNQLVVDSEDLTDQPDFEQTLFARYATRQIRTMLDPNSTQEDIQKANEPIPKRKLFEPVQLTAQDIKDIETWASVLDIKSIAALLGCTVRALEKIFHRNPEVEAAYKRGRAALELIAGKKLIENAIIKGKEASLFFLLKTRFRWTEINHMRHDINNASNPNAKVEIILQSIQTNNQPHDENINTVSVNNDYNADADTIQRLIDVSDNNEINQPETTTDMRNQ